jgi:hypothetical protein
MCRADEQPRKSVRTLVLLFDDPNEVMKCGNNFQIRIRTARTPEGLDARAGMIEIQETYRSGFLLLSLDHYERTGSNCLDAIFNPVPLHDWQ